jgi:hypothetical protein
MRHFFFLIWLCANLSWSSSVLQARIDVCGSSSLVHFSPENYNVVVQSLFALNNIDAAQNCSLSVSVWSERGVWGPEYTIPMKVESSTSSYSLYEVELFSKSDSLRKYSLFAPQERVLLNIADLFAFDSLNTGVQTLVFRARSFNGEWGPYFEKNVEITQGIVHLGIQQMRLSIEGLDEQLFYGDSSIRSVMESGMLQTSAFSEAGVYPWTVEVLSGGVWSAGFRGVLFVSSGKGALELQAGRYFWNSNPEQYEYLVAADGEAGSALEKLADQVDFYVDRSADVLNVQVMGADGQWGHPLSVPVESIQNSSMSLSQVRYFWNDDTLSAETILFEGDSSSALKKIQSLWDDTGISGVKKLTLQFSDGSGTWGKPFSAPVKIEESARNYSVRDMEYFCGTDPGEGQANALVLNNGEKRAYSPGVAYVGDSVMTAGRHHCYIRALSNSGGWGKPYAFVLNVYDEGTSSVSLSSDISSSGSSSLEESSSSEGTVQIAGAGFFEVQHINSQFVQFYMEGEGVSGALFSAEGKKLHGFKFHTAFQTYTVFWPEQISAGNYYLKLHSVTADKVWYFSVVQ